MTRVMIIHKWEGESDHDWYLWLKEALQKKGIDAKVLEMPDTLNPKIEKWVSKLRAEIGTPDNDTYLVGHSMGCQAIFRYLETLPENERIGGTLLVAGFVTLIDESVEPGKVDIIEPWLTTKIFMEKVHAHCNTFVSIFSDNDPYVGLENAQIFKERLHSKIIIMPKAGHFGAKDGYNELHVALNELLKMIK